MISTKRPLVVVALTSTLNAFAAAEPVTTPQAAPALTVDYAITIAHQRDPWISASQSRESSLQAEAISASTMPDPRLSFSLANIPVDSFSLRDEGMSQVVIGASQIIPRGNTLALLQQQKNQLAAQHPSLRRERRAKVASIVAELWLNIYLIQESERLISEELPLFQQLASLTDARYRSALGKTRQADVIRAQLEYTKLRDRLLDLAKQKKGALQKLGEWIGVERLPTEVDIQSEVFQLYQPRILEGLDGAPHYQRALVENHPSVQAFDALVGVSHTQTELAKQRYRPEWMITAQYGIRDTDPTGNDRSDLFSVGVSFDLPLFTSNRQDKDVAAAIANTKALESDRERMLRSLEAMLLSSVEEWRQVSARVDLYLRSILPESRMTKEAARSAYMHDDGDFPELVRAQIAELNAKLELVNLQVTERKYLVQLNYILVGAMSGTTKHSAASEGEQDE